MPSNIENINSYPKCEARLLVFTYEGPDKYLSCTKCSWKILEKSSAAPKAAKAKKRVNKQNKKRIEADSRSGRGTLHYDFVAGTQPILFSFVRCTNLRCEKITSVHKRTEKCPWWNKLGQAEQIPFTEFTSRHHEAYNRKVGILSEREQYFFDRVFFSKPVVLVIIAVMGFGILATCSTDRNRFGYDVRGFDNPAFDAR